MKTASLLLLVAALAALVSGLSIWFYPSLQDFVAANTVWNGLSRFSSETGAAYVDSLDTLPADAGGALLAIPCRPYSPEDIARLGAFIQAGGTLLLMDDFGYGNEVLAGLGVDIRFNGKPLLDPLFCYRNAGMPRISHFTEDIAAAGISSILCNHPTALTGAGAEAIAFSSATGFLDTNDNGKRDESEPAGLLPVAARVSLGAGRLVLVADPSLIINTMLDRADNRKFIELISGNPGGFIIDRDHINRAPLDISKVGLARFRTIIAGPYALVGVIALLFAAIAGGILRKEVIHGS